MIFATAGVPLGSKDEQGRTALRMTAANGNGHLDSVDYLIGRVVVKNLKLAGADASLLNSHELTPIDEAMSREKMEVIDAINTAVAQLELVRTAVS